MPAKVGTNFADKRRSVTIVRSRTQTTAFVFYDDDDDENDDFVKSAD
jgi:hypothetical protein